MTIVEFEVNKSKYTIECPEEEKEKVLKLAKKIDKRAKTLAKHFAKIDEKTLLAICCLMMQDELEGSKKSDSSEIPENSESIDDAIKNAEKLSSRIENLAKKIEKY